MLEGFIKQVRKEIRYWETHLTQHQDKMNEAQINEVLERLDSLYESLRMLTS